MSMRVEWMDAAWTRVHYVEAGENVIEGHEETEVTGEAAVALVADEVTVIEGDRDQLAHIALTILRLTSPGVVFVDRSELAELAAAARAAEGAVRAGRGDYVVLVEDVAAGIESLAEPT